MDVLHVLDGSSDDEGDSHVGDPATGRSGPERDGSGGGGGGGATSLSEQGEPQGAGAAEATCIKVALRIRPALPRELFHPAGFRTVADPGTEGTTIRVLPPANAPRHRQADVTSSFDRVFGIEASQAAVFEFIRPVVDGALEGRNATVFAYGMTSSGKTYTMLGRGVEDALVGDGTDEGVWRGPNESADGLPEHWGLAPRALWRIFQAIRASDGAGHTATVAYASFLQVYQDNVFDLLNDRRHEYPLALRESVEEGEESGEVYVPDLTEHRVRSLGDVMALLRRGSRNRVMRATDMNEHSSRSHVILQLHVETERLDGPRKGQVDLAGSEKWRVVGETIGKRHARELTNINGSLSALGNVVSALSETNRQHIPYRDSKLTRLLQDSLGGNSVTALIANISPAEEAYEETLSTLQFADRARQVMVRARVNAGSGARVQLAEANVRLLLPHACRAALTAAGPTVCSEKLRS